MKRFIILFFLPFVFAAYSCEQIVMEDDISESAVALTAPFDNAEFNSTSVTFHWEPVESATQYRLQIARPDFQNSLEIVVDVLVDTNSSVQQLNLGSYQWRVKAVNSSYETPYTTRTFHISGNDDFQNNTVILVTPENNLITNQSSQFLSWQNVTGATGYQLQVYNSSNVTLLDQTTTATSYNFSFPDGSYNWRVRASNGNMQTMYTNRTLLVDTVVPNTPTLTSPPNNATLAANEVSFQWNRTAISGSAEKDSIYVYKNIALTDLEIKTASTSPYTNTLDSGIYYWYTKSFDAAGNNSAQSNVFNFTVN